MRFCLHSTWILQRCNAWNWPLTGPFRLMCQGSSIYATASTEGVQVAPERVHIRVLDGGGLRSDEKSILLKVDNVQYMFNSPEAIGRHFRSDPSLNFTGFDNLFVTRQSWSCTGGLLDIFFTLGRAGVETNFTVHGPPGVANLIPATRIPGNVLPFSPVLIYRQYAEGVFIDRDNNVEFEPVPIYASSLEGSPVPKEGGGRKAEAVCYICNIKRTEQLTLQDDSAKVLTSEKPGLCIIVADCPSLSCLDSLMQAPSFDLLKGEGTASTALIVHFTPVEVMTDQRYQKWAEKISCSSTAHLLLNDLCPSLPLPSIFQLQTVLNMVDNELFSKIPSFETALKGIRSGEAASKILSELFKFADADKVMLAEPYSTLKLLPTLDLNSRCVSNFPEIQKTILENVRQKLPDFEKLFTETRRSVNLFRAKRTTKSVQGPPRVTTMGVGTAGFVQPPQPCLPPKVFGVWAGAAGYPFATTPGDDRYPEVIFLGTNSSISDRFRSVTGVLLNVTQKQSILLDCGYGTYNQMLQFFGADGIDSALLKLDAIFVSHLHTDHCYGLFSVLQQRKIAFERMNIPFKPVLILSNEKLFAMHVAFSKSVENISGLADRRSVPIDRFCKQSLQRIPTRSQDSEVYRVQRMLGLKTLAYCPVRHSMYPMGFLIETQCGKRMIYSGDTTPCPDLIQMGQNCDLLIHEATYPDDRAWKAGVSQHCTVSQALEVASAMNAKFTILTHFSERSRPNYLPYTDVNLGDRVALAHDFMRVSLRDLPVLPLLTPLLNYVCSAPVTALKVYVCNRGGPPSNDYNPAREGIDVAAEMM